MDTTMIITMTPLPVTIIVIAAAVPLPATIANTAANIGVTDTTGIAGIAGIEGIAGIIDPSAPNPEGIWFIGTKADIGSDA